MNRNNIYEIENMLSDMLVTEQRIESLMSVVRFNIELIDSYVKELDDIRRDIYELLAGV